MSESGVEGLEQLEVRLSEMSERRAANARRLLEDIEDLRREAREQGKHLVVRDAAQLLEKLQSTNTPMLTGVGWNAATTHSPGKFDFYVTFFNPDPTAWIWVYGYVFIGPALLPADVGQALALADTRFPRLTLPGYPGFNLQSGAGGRLDFSLPVPKNIEPTTYLGNCFLFRCNYFGVADYFDRCQFILEVT
jgi:hypothetical protein